MLGLGLGPTLWDFSCINLQMQWLSAIYLLLQLVRGCVQTLSQLLHFVVDHPYALCVSGVCVCVCVCVQFHSFPTSF